ncbi:MAG: hypothetical protein UU43_C0001G0082 [Candidatus Falkowbacteria bacterium GW2011_GWA2_41_14]|uniref:Uncharacterized protein n=1 Tax=Candidatus Falkowbacteria bacterium GW2011_GWA2_41_14 TaxID=1618635 RepID=A0A0G0XVE0_9BACT|nr:MAG: hypothetical protein UU43_C0001G0082 [Candidatus Falkowbacteria bacterium GW2011_GWA2_41_14]
MFKQLFELYHNCCFFPHPPPKKGNAQPQFKKLGLGEKRGPFRIQIHLDKYFKTIYYLCPDRVDNPYHRLIYLQLQFAPAVL